MKKYRLYIERTRARLALAKEARKAGNRTEAIRLYESALHAHGIALVLRKGV